MKESSKEWKPIEDLPDNWESWRSPTLESLASAWKKRSLQLQGSQVLAQFKQALREEWFSQVKLLEYLYSTDRGITRTFLNESLERSLPTQSTESRLAELSIPRHIRALFDFVTQERQLSAFFIKQLHQELTRNQTTTWALNSLGDLIQVPLAAGEWKTLPNNPQRPDGTFAEYCPPEQVISEIERLVTLHVRHLSINVPSEIQAAWLHHRFTQIHPFQDGNGRVARMLASLIFVQNGLFPLVIQNRDRDEYIRASEAADRGDLSRLINLFSRLEGNIIIKGLSLAS